MSLTRFVLRVRKGRVWWDDWLVLVATVADIIYMLTLWPSVLDGPCSECAYTPDSDVVFSGRKSGRRRVSK